MASTFHVFRKNQRLLMAVFGVLLMIAFTLSSVPAFLADRASPQNPLIATTRFGNIHAYDVAEMLEQRNIVKQFLFQIMIQARMLDWIDNMQRQFGQDLQKLLSPQTLQGIQARLGNDLQFELSQTIGPSTERSVVETRLQAQLGEREGVVISDDAITEYIRLQSGDRVSGEQMKAAMAQLPTRSRQRVSKARLYEALRTELAAAKYRQFFLLGMQMTPAERWEYYARLKRRASAEIVPLAASEMLSQVKEPSERELVAFFDEHKQEEAVPGSPKPGFKVPHKAAFEYLRADYEKFYDEAVISDKELEEEYEKHKDEKYRYSSLASEPETDEETKPEEPATKDEKPAAGDKNQAETKQSEPAGKEKPSDEPSSKKEPEKQSNDTSSDSDNDEFVDRDPAKDDQPPATQDAAATEPVKKEEPAKTDEPPKKSEPTPTHAGPPSDMPFSYQPPGEQSPTADKQALDLKAPENAPTTPAAPKISTAPMLLDRFALPQEITGGKSPTHAPLWQVRERIRKELAGARAVAKIDAVLQKLQTEMRQYTRRRADAEFRSEPLPSPLDLATLAKEGGPGITNGSMKLTSAYELGQDPGLGETTVGGDSITDFAYGGLKLYTSVQAQDSAGDRYLFWKTDDVPAHVPELAEVRGDVDRAWKMIQARELVRGKADELAAKARAAAKPLKETLGSQGYTVTETEPFSWLLTSSAGDFNASPTSQIGEVQGVVDPGPDFMRAVFSLGVGDVGVAMNNPETVAYIVRLTSLEPAESVLRDTFFADKGGTPQQVSQASRLDQRKIVDAWREKFIADARLVWVQPPNDDVAAE
ncbi:MAG TPA: hypothetical protein VHZ24_23135 [Pirellulales bacterium]|nr:hypothetical protein [Pirellulales bacterium]